MITLVVVIVSFCVISSILVPDALVVTEKYGSALTSWEASNIAVTSASSGGITHSDAIFTPNTATADWSLNVTTRASGTKLEEITQTDAITTTSVITSLSVFSQ